MARLQHGDDGDKGSGKGAATAMVRGCGVGERREGQGLRSPVRQVHVIARPPRLLCLPEGLDPAPQKLA